MMRAWFTAGSAIAVLALLAKGSRAAATVEMQNAAKALGFPLKNCVYCHASPHAVEKMKETAREVGVSAGNCLQCHGADIPAALNDRGQWLVDEKARRHADKMDMAWLKDYKEPSPEEDPKEKAPAKE
jgi:mono/diheme cytochrome c family protein